MASGAPPEPAVNGRAPLCFVVTPFGLERDGRGLAVDFDRVYRELLAPAIREARLEPLRADQELVAGLIHKPIFERLILSDYAVVDLTTANATLFYALGVRHAVRPYSTVLVSAELGRLPFDLAPDRVLRYTLDADGAPADPGSDRIALVTALGVARRAATDSPVFQLIDEVPTAQLDRLKTDVFRAEAAYSVDAKERLARARAAGVEAVRAIARELGPLEDVEAGVLVDLLLSYRAVKAWEDMIGLVDAMPAPLARTVLVREQYGFALNRAKRDVDAERVLLEVIADHGPSSETFGLLGRVYKDRWEAERTVSALRAEGDLERAIDAYRRGFESDWRDAYPGVNAVTLMELREPGGAAQQELLPVVKYANRRRIEGGHADYWDHATRLELGVIARDQEEARAGARSALASVRELWELESTAYNLGLIRQSREERGVTVSWADDLERELRKAATRS
jgi:hypothetical protein